MSAVTRLFAALVPPLPAERLHLMSSEPGGGHHYATRASWPFGDRPPGR